jgi:hypothetical protein
MLRYAPPVTPWAALANELVRRVQRDLEAVLSDIDPAWLDRPVGPGANPIGWLAWHLTRSHDRNVSELSGREQLWTGQGWAARFGRDPDPAETGFAHTAEQVAAFVSPPAPQLIAYHRAVVEMVSRYLADAGDDELDRVTTSPTLGDTRTVRDRMAGILTEGLEHVGQMAYLRGLYQVDSRT